MSTERENNKKAKAVYLKKGKCQARRECQMPYRELKRIESKEKKQANRRTSNLLDTNASVRQLDDRIVSDNGNGRFLLLLQDVADVELSCLV